jgi:putative ABC transport system substrate-binding protein
MTNQFLYKRREFIALLGSGVAGWPLTARAQQQRAMPVIGFLNAASSNNFAHVTRAFHRGLEETGHVVGQNVSIEYRWADGQYDRLPALAQDLVRQQVSVIATGSATSAALAAKAATATIPIVFLTGADPVQEGLVANLNRPGGNLTGVTTLNMEIAPKLLELLCQLLPAADTMAVLVNRLNIPSVVETQSTGTQAAARTLGLKTIHVLSASTERELDNAFSAVTAQRAGGLIISADTFFSGKSAELAALALRHAVPSVSPYREFAVAGGLMSYGGSVTELYRLVGAYTGRILRGERPADLPVQQVTKVELVINLKTAKALGLEVPPMLLARADEVIE